MTATVRRSAHTTKAQFTRPADTSVYTAGDVANDSTSAATILTFNGCARGDGEASLLQEVLVATSVNGTPKPDLELWFFSAAPAVVNDNAAFAPTDAEILTLVAVVPVPVASFKVGLTGASGNAVCDVTNVGVVTSHQTLYCVPVVRNAYTPASGEVISITLKFLD